MGSEEQWEMATNALRDAMESIGMKYKINEGDGAFYGLKLIFILKIQSDGHAGSGTIQLDFQMPENLT